MQPRPPRRRRPSATRPSRGTERRGCPGSPGLLEVPANQAASGPMGVGEGAHGWAVSPSCGAPLTPSLGARLLLRLQPVGGHHLDRALERHAGYLVLRHAGDVDELVDQARRQRLRGRLGGGRPAVGQPLVPDARPELGLRDVELVREDVLPQAEPVGGVVGRPGDVGPQDPAVGQGQLVGDVVLDLATAGVADLVPALGLAEAVVVAPAGRPAAHAGTSARAASLTASVRPTSHSRSWSSSESSTSSTRLRWPAWLGPACSRSFQSLAYSRSPAMRSSMASSKDSASPCTGTPGTNAAQPPPSETTTAWEGSSRRSSAPRTSAVSTTNSSLSRVTVVTTPSWAASRTQRSFERASVKLSKWRRAAMLSSSFPGVSPGLLTIVPGHLPGFTVPTVVQLWPLLSQYVQVRQVRQVRACSHCSQQSHHPQGGTPAPAAHVGRARGRAPRPAAPGHHRDDAADRAAARSGGHGAGDTAGPPRAARRGPHRRRRPCGRHDPRLRGAGGCPASRARAGAARRLAVAPRRPHRRSAPPPRQPTSG